LTFQIFLYLNTQFEIKPNNYKQIFYSRYMKNWKSILVTVLTFFTIGGMVVFTSCEKDPCSELACKNGGNCSDGYCQCPVGFEGAECDITAASRFVGKYFGSTRCENFPIEPDTVYIDLVKEPNEIQLRLGSGNTALLGFSGTARTPETHFVTHIDENITVHAYITVDGDLLALYLETIRKDINLRQICHFSGQRVAQ
jgi:hypothetical protein